MSARRIPRRFGMLASDFTQCQYLTTKDSMPCNVLVIPALVKYVRLIAVLKAQPSLRSRTSGFLTSIHNTLRLQGNPSITSREKPSYPAQTATMISHVVCEQAEEKTRDLWLFGNSQWMQKPGQSSRNYRPNDRIGVRFISVIS